MDIIFNHTLRSIKSNWLQFVVILVTITFVTTVVFVAMTIEGLFYNVNVGMDSRLGAGTDITIDGDVFSQNRINEFFEENANKIEFIDTYLQIPALFREDDKALSKAVLVEATDLEMLVDRHPSYVLIKEEYKNNYQYPAVWVGEGFAKANKLSVGDTIEVYLELYKEYEKLTVTYIMEDKGMFANSVVSNLVLDFDAINNKGVINLANFKLKENVDVESFKGDILKFLDNPDIKANDSVDYDNIDSIVSNNQLLLNICLIFMLALMLYILFTSYFVIMKNRMSELAIFKSAGASSKQIIGIMLFESIMYGFFGSILGLILGRVGMLIVVKTVIPNFPNAVEIGIIDYVISFLLGIIVSIASATIPAIKASKMSIRELTTGGVKSLKKPKPVFLIIVTILLVVATLVFIFVPKMALLAIILMTLLVSIFIVLFMPYIINAVSYLMSKGKGSHVIAGMGLKRNGYSKTLSSMFCSIIAFTFIIVMIINVIIVAISPFNERFSGDYVIQGVQEKNINSVLSKVENIYGVENAYKYYYDDFIWDFEGEKTDYKVYGIDSTKALDNIATGISSDTIKRFESTVNAIIINYDIADRFKLEVGDKITLNVGTKIQEVGQLTPIFEVVGLEYSMTQNDRVMIIANDKFFMDDKNYSPKGSIIFCNIADDIFEMDFYRDAREIIEEEQCYILTLEDWANSTSVGIKGVMLLLQIIQILISSVALIGIINIIIVAFGERRQEFAIYKSIGMDKKKQNSIIITEGFIIALSGGLLGIIMMLVVNLLIPSFALIIDRYILFNPFPLQIPIIFGIFIGVFVIFYWLVATLLSRKALAKEKTPLY